ncbi:MAG: DUF6510 family protein [Pseudolysinimonas sp.]
MTHHMTHVDGNVLAGKLADLFAFDGTMTSIRCPGCSTVEVLATAMVYMDEMGAVARCVHCDAVLLTVVEGDGRSWVSFSGAVAIEVSP